MKSAVCWQSLPSMTVTLSMGTYCTPLFVGMRKPMMSMLSVAVTLSRNLPVFCAEVLVTVMGFSQGTPLRTVLRPSVITLTLVPASSTSPSCRGSSPKRMV